MVSRNVVEIIINAIDNANKTIRDINKNLQNMGNTGKDSNDKITDSTSRVQQAMDKLSGVSNSVKNGFNTIGNVGASALNNIRNVVGSVTASVSNLSTKFSSLTSSFSTVGESIKASWSSTTEYLKGVWNSFTGSLGDIGSSISNSLNGASASISGLFQSIRDEASSVNMSFSGIGEGIRESLNGASASISGVFQSIRNEASSVSMSFSGIGEGIRESLNGASASISSIFASIRNEASSLGSSVSGAFSGIGSSISSAKNGVLGMADGMSDLGDLIASKIGITGVGSVKELTIGLALSREKMTTLMRATMGSAEAADKLINKWDSMTDNSVVSLDMMIGAFNKVKMSSGQSAEKLSKLANSQKMVNGHSTNLSSTLIRLGEAALLMGDDAGHAQFVMADAMDGLNDNFRTLQFNLGITKEKVLEQGWSGSKDDVEGYTAALNGCLDQMGDMSQVMNTNAGAIQKLEKAFRVAGRKIGEIILPIIGGLIDTFNWLDQVLDLGATNDDGTHKSLHRLYTATVLLFGGLSIVATILPLLALGLKLYNGAVASGVISTKLMTAVLGEEAVAEGTMIGLTDLLSLSFWQAVFAEYAFLAPLILITAAIVGVIAVMKYLYDNNETVRHSINVLGYYLNNIFVKAWEQLQKILAPLGATLQNLWNTFKYLAEVLTGTNEATDGASRGFDWLEAIIYSVGHVFLRLVETIVAVVEVIVGILVPIISLVINIFAELIKFVIKVAQAFSLLMQGDYVGFFNTLKDAIWNLVSNIATYIGQALLEIYHNLWSILGNVLTAIGQWLSQVPGIIWGFILSIPSLIYKGAQLVLYAIGFLLGLIWKYLTEWQPQLLAMIGSFLIYLGQMFIEKGIPAIISFGEQMYVAIKDAFWNAINGAKEILPQLPQIMWDELVRAGQFIWNAGGMILDAIWGLCQSIIDGFLDALGIHSPGTMANAIKDEMGRIPEFILNAIPNILIALSKLAMEMIRNFGDKIKELPQLVSSIFGDGAGQLVQTLIDVILPVLSTILEIIQQFILYLLQVKDAIDLLLQGDYEGFFSLIMEALMNFITNVGTLLLNLVTTIWDWGMQVKDYVIQTAWEMVTGFLTWLSTLPAQAWAWLLQCLTDLWNWGSQMRSSIVQTATNMVNGFINWIKTLPEKAWTWLMGVINKIISFGGSAPQHMWNAAVSIYNKFKNKVQNLPQAMWDELVHIKDKILSGVGMVVDAMRNLAESMLNKFKDTLGIHSPGFISELTGQEMDYTNEALLGANKTLEKSAESVGKSILNGYNKNDFSQMNDAVTANVNTNVPQTPVAEVTQPVEVQPMVDPNANQEAVTSVTEQNNLLAQNVATNSLLINSSLNSTTMAMNLLSSTSVTANATVNQSNLLITQSYLAMASQVNNVMNQIINKNISGWNDVKTKTESNLNSILSSTKNVTTQMIQAWEHMKSSIVKAADNIKSESTNRFNTLWSTIKTFYHNIQHPGGAGSPTSPSTSRRLSRGGRGFSSIGSALTTGLASVMKPRKRTLSQLDLSTAGFNTQQIEYMIPQSDKMVKTSDIFRFLNSKSGAGWDDVVKPNNKYIKDKSNLWSVAGPVILGKYPTGLDIFKVKDFENGTPNISYETFKKMAEAVFSQCHYEFYMDSDKYGSWQVAARGGGMNCSDSTDFLIALAHACGLSASKVHGHWNSIGHFWADVEGHKLDTTGWMLHHNWTPSQSHAGPSPQGYDETIDSTTIVNKIDELITQIRDYGNEAKDRTVEYGGNIKLQIEHIITGELPQGMTKEEVADILSEKLDDTKILKQITSNPDFQYYDERYKNKIMGAKGRFS